MANKEVYSEKVVGVTFEGRQQVVASLVAGQQLRLIHEPYNVHDANATRVETLDGRQIGYIGRDVAKKIASVLDKAGGTIPASVVRVTGGGAGKSYGVVITFRVSQTPPRRERPVASQPEIHPDPKPAAPSRRRRWGLSGGSLTLVLVLCFLARNAARISRYFPSGSTAPIATLSTGAGGAVWATPTHLPRPTQRITTRPAATRPTGAGSGNQQLTASSDCMRWQNAEQYIGTTQCVCGEVSHTKSNKDGVFFIHFDTDRLSFYGVSFQYYWEQGSLEGECLWLCGEVESNYGRPRIVIADPGNQVFQCP